MSTQLDRNSCEWYAVRLVLERFDAGDYIDLEPDERVYEETIRLVKATSHDDCLDEAEKVIKAEIADGADYSYTGYAEGFKLFDDLEHGAEVYTTLRRSKLDSTEYIKRYLRTEKEIGFAHKFDSDDDS